MSRRITIAEALDHAWLHKDEEALRATDISLSAIALKKYRIRKKFRAGVKAIIAANRFRSAGEHFRAFHHHVFHEDGSSDPIASVVPPQSTSHASREADGEESVGTEEGDVCKGTTTNGNRKRSYTPCGTDEETVTPKEGQPIVNFKKVNREETSRGSNFLSDTCTIT